MVLGALQYSDALYCMTNVLRIENNKINMHQAAAPVAGFVGCLSMHNIPTTGAFTYSDGLVTGNIFSRRNLSTNQLTSLLNSYITIFTTSGAGVLVDNNFDSTTINGASTLLVNDQTSTWHIHRNKNQTEIISIYGFYGQLGLKGYADDGYVASGKAPSVTNSNVYFKNDASATMFFDNNDGSFEVAAWYIPLMEVLPEGVTVTYLDTLVSSDIPAGAPSIVKLALATGGTEDYAEYNGLDVGVGAKALQITASVTRKVLPTNNPLVYLAYMSGAGSLFQARYINITYHW